MMNPDRLIEVDRRNVPLRSIAEIGLRLRKELGKKDE